MTLQELLTNQTSILSDFKNRLNNISEMKSDINTLNESIAIVAENVNSSLNNLNVYTKNEIDDMIDNINSRLS